MEIKGIELLSDDLTGTLHFYSAVLGLTVMKCDENLVRFQAGDSILTFIRSPGLKPVYHFAFTIPDNNLNEALHFVSVRAAILPVVQDQLIADFSKWNAKAFYFLDNNGNIVEYIARFDLNKKSTLPFNGTSIVSISEIGIVTDDVDMLADQLMEKENLSLFSRQERHPDFTVLGDDLGLLILVSENRDWFPTAIKSGKFYSKVHLKLAGREKTLLFNDHL